jgi:hypothetical protein
VEPYTRVAGVARTVPVGVRKHEQGENDDVI